MSATMDDVLDLLRDTGPEFQGGLSNHGPMAAEALFALGRGDTALSWAEAYRGRLEEHPRARDPIAPDEWQQWLGDAARMGDWIAFFDRGLAGSSWASVVGRWVPRLIPGIFAAATHGAIRTGHAVRSLASGETPQRVHELAEGLGYWAARYLILPGQHAAAGQHLPSQAIHHVDLLPAERRQESGLITARVRRLEGFAPFTSVIDLVDAAADPARFISDLTETFARVYLENAPHPRRAIAFIHAVTGPSMLRVLAPYLSHEAVVLGLHYGWQAAAALHAACGQRLVTNETEAPSCSQEELIDRAVATGNEHAIKFTEACLREAALNPSPVYLTAAWDATQRLG